MDAFARRHNRRSPVPWLSVNWDVWRIPSEAHTDSGLGATLKDMGMSAEEATEMMERALAGRSAGQLVVSTGDLDARIKQWIKLESLTLKGLTAATRATRSPRPRSGLQTSSEGPRDETEQQICRIWQDALGVDEIGINDNFSELGGHSLLAIKIVSELRGAFQIDLPIRALFDAPTISKLSDYIKEQIITEIEALTDDQARQLVSSI